MEIDGLSSDVHTDLSILAASGDGHSPSALARVLNRLDLHINVSDASFALTLPESDISLSDATFSLHMDHGISGTTLAGDARRALISTGGLHGAFDDLRFGLDKDGRVGLEAAQGTLENSEGRVDATLIIAAYQENSELSLSAHDVDLAAADLALKSPQVVARLRMEAGQPVDYTLSVDGLDAQVASYRASIPTTTISGLLDEGMGRHSLALASRSGEAFSVSLDTLGTLQAHTLGAHFTYDGSGPIWGEVTLQSVDWEQKVALEGLTLSLLSLDLESRDIKVNASGDLSLTLPHDFGVLEAPLSASLGYQIPEGAITATLEVETTQIASPFDLLLSYQGRDREAQLQADLSIREQASLSALYNRGGEESALIVNGRLTELRAQTFAPFVESRAQYLKPYLEEQTTLSGNISFNGQEGGGERSGRITTELALIDAAIGKTSIDAGMTILGSLEGEKLSVSSLTLATSGYRLAFTGETELNYWLPRGELSLYRTDDGQLLAKAEMVDRPPAGYEFSLRTILEPIITIDGEVGKRTSKTIAGEALLTFGDDHTPFTFDLATDTLALSVKQEEHLDLKASLAPPQSLEVRGSHFSLPGSTAAFSGTVNAFFSSLTDWSIDSSDLSLENITLKGHRYDLSSPFRARSNEISIPSFTIASDGVSHTGSLSYQGADLARLRSSSFLAPYTATLKLDDLLKISLSSSTSEIEVAALIADFPIGQLTDGGESLLSLSVVGTTDLASAVSLDGMVSYGDGHTGISTSFTLGERSFEFFDTRYTKGELSITADQLRFADGTLSIIANLDHIRHLSYKDQPSHISLAFTLPLPGVETFFELAKENIGLLDRRLEATLSLDDIVLLGEGGIADGTYALLWEEGMISAESELLSLAYDTTNAHISLRLLPEFGIGLNAHGSVGAADFGIVLTDLYLPLEMLNRTFLKPVFLFHSGIGEGEIFLGGSREAIRPYGQLNVDATEMFVFWLPDDLIHMKGASITIDGSRATTGRVPFFSTNTKTNKTVHGYGDLSAHFDGLSLLNYEIHANDLSDPVYVWIPMAGFEADFRGYAIGTFNLFGIGFQTWLDGDVTISDTTMTLGIKGLPDWYVPAYMTSTTFNVTTAKGVSFFYPNTPTPFIKATLTENQEFSFTYDHVTNEFEIDGVFAFRSGEIYYFQKNFFITEGSMVLHTDALSGEKAITPLINLRAKVTDFDSSGNRIDIFLVLRDSTLTALNPQFESIPAKEVNEIMEILGQSILPTGAYGEIGLYSVASLAAAATDVAERLGLLEVTQTALLTEAIRISLGLDMFSIRSNIVQNILFDALPITGLMGSLSPIARYLHNTSIFMGKYIGTNFFLQALVHLSRSI